jgi:hypothetical protein
MKVPQEMYAAATMMSRGQMAKAMSDPQIADLCKQARAIPLKDWSPEHPLVKRAGRALIKAGVTTALGFNFYDLRGPAYFIFPLLTPFIQMIGKSGKVNAGVGTSAHWKATRNPNSTFVYSGLLEGQRNAIATPNEVDYLATYKEMGMDGGETFTAQFAGEGYTDNLADEHFRNLARLRLQEEMMTIWGNSGPNSLNAGNLGFALGQATNVTSALATGTGALGTSANVVVAVVAITGMGMNPGGQAGYAAPPSVVNGLTTNYVRTNADGTTTNVACGCSAISNVAALVTTNAAAQKVNVSIPAMKGAVAYAWFWGVNVSASAANVKLGAITAWPSYTIVAAAAGTQTGAAAGLNVDNSYQTTDFDGLGTYTFLNGNWTDMNGGSLTPAGNGQVAEIEADLAFMWNNYQAQPDAIWVSSDVRASLESAVIYSSTGTNSFVFGYDKAGQDSGLTAGFAVTGYKSKYSISPTGSAVIPIRLHPMFPAGTIVYDINTNPYPHSRIPAVRQFLTQRDYYAIEWPTVSRQWTFGTYIHQVLAHYMPWITAVRTGIGPFVAPCWLAAVAFDENFFTGPRVSKCRTWLVNDYEKSGPVAKLVMDLYRTYGERAARVVEKSSFLKAGVKALFSRILKKAEAKYGPVQS